jgi:hypothetical protein
MEFPPTLPDISPVTITIFSVEINIPGKDPSTENDTDDTDEELEGGMEIIDWGKCTDYNIHNHQRR